MQKKKNIIFISIAVITAVILIASLLAYILTPGSKLELNIAHAQGLIMSIKKYHFSQYPDFNELFYTGGKGYEFKNASADKLIIYLGGFGWGSAIEPKWSGKLIDVLLEIKELNERYTFFIPEKFNREIGALYGLDAEERRRYTINNLLDNYYDVIREYLAANNFKSIVIYGTGEGAFILPVLFTRLENHNITALISDAGGGGLSYFEQQKVLQAKLLANDKSFAQISALKEDRLNLINYYETWMRTFQAQPAGNSDEFFRDSPMTYRWFNSIIQLRLYEYYEKINIPVLFIHGNSDTTVPVETTQYIENNLPGKPFNFYYYAEMTHNQIKQQQYQPQKDITEWVLKTDL